MEMPRAQMGMAVRDPRAQALIPNPGPPLIPYVEQVRKAMREVTVLMRLQIESMLDLTPDELAEYRKYERRVMKAQARSQRNQAAAGRKRRHR